MNWTGLFLFLATAVTFFVFGMMIMAVCSASSQYEATTEAFNAGYERGKAEEKERVGKLLDKYIEDLERGKRRDSERVSVSDSVS
jgi:hypothetical protein